MWGTNWNITRVIISRLGSIRGRTIERRLSVNERIGCTQQQQQKEQS